MAGVALVVGASSGLGRAVAERLSREGYRTYAGARSFAAPDAQARVPGGCTPIALDVTDDASVAEAVARVTAEAGRIDVLVNCAAQLMLGAMEEISDAELRQVLETNVLGTARMTRAVLPGMRAQGAGRILQFSSLNGRFGIPFQGAYAASKHAIEGFSEALAMEVMPYGIQVTLVEPGDCRHGASAYRGRAAMAERDGSPYRGAYRAAVQKISQDEENGLMPDTVARAVVRALRRRHAPARIVVASPDQRLALWLHGLLPGRLFYRILMLYYRPKAKRNR